MLGRFQAFIGWQILSFDWCKAGFRLLIGTEQVSGFDWVPSMF